MSPRLNLAAAQQHLESCDVRLGRLIQRVGVCTLQPRVEHSIFYSLLRAIVYQQLAGAAAATILGRVEALFPDHAWVHPDDIAAAADEDFRAAGLSRNKLAAIRDLAAKTLDGTVPTLARARRMSDEALIERLTAIRGVGRWTVEMLLIFRLGRPDVLPLDDYGIRKGFQHTFKTAELPSKQQMARRAQRWAPYRSIASWYLWRALDIRTPEAS